MLGFTDRKELRNLRQKMITLMQAKKGIHFTLGWLKSSYTMGQSNIDVDADWLRAEIAELESMPDFEDA